MLEVEECYKGQPQEALKKLAEYADPDGRIADLPVFWNRPADWPKDARGLTSELERLVPVLRSHSVEYTPPRKANGKRIMRLCKIPSGARVDSVA
jgi:hypothetical protein